jgi:uncharacterized protein (TIGR02266 family)
VSADFWADALHLLAALDRRSYYQLLEVTPEATGDAVREAFARRVAAYHPDRHAREPNPERRRALVSLQARFNEAYRVLSDPKQRAEYDRGLASGQLRHVARPAGVVDEPRSPQARRYFQFGKDCERANDRAGARMNYEFAAQLEPDCAAVREALARIAAAAKPPAPVEPPPPPSPPSPAVAEQRAAPRHPFARPVRLHCHTWKRFETIYARDLSAGGMFLKTTTPLEVGARLQLAIVVPDGRVLALDAEVAHVIAPDRADAGATPGIGIRFLALDEDRRAQLDELLRAAAAQLR